GSPDFYLRFELGKSETQIAKFFLEIKNDQKGANDNGDEGSERRAGHAQFWERSDSKDQKRREHHIQNDADHLKNHRRLNDSSRAQSRAHCDDWELQQHGGKKPSQIALGQGRGLRIRAQCIRIPVHREKSEYAERKRDQDRHHAGLIENELGMRLIFSSGSLG